VIFIDLSFLSIFKKTKKQELHRRGGHGIVQDAVLIGTPVTGNPTEWRPLLDVVAGRLINAFSQ
jgi:hypothetical protein